MAPDQNRQYRQMIEVRLFDPDSASRHEWAAVHLFRRARNDEDTPGDLVLDDAESERQLRHSWPLYENLRWYAWSGDDIAGVVGVGFRRENTASYDDHAPYLYASGGVHAHWRRQGVAAKLLRPVLDLMQQRNKTVATFDTSVPDGHAFLAAIGATLKHRQIENRAPFSGLDWEMLARWHDAAVPRSAPLHWEIFPDRVPPDRLNALFPQFDALQADLPLGDLDRPPPRSEPSAWLTWYEELDRHGGDHMLVMLIEGDIIAAICEASWDARHPDRVFQLLTAVARPWRRHGLAKGVKAAMLRLIRSRHPDVRFITTSNANVNAPILSINTRLGFTEHRCTASYQVGPNAIEAFLERRADICCEGPNERVAPVQSRTITIAEDGNLIDGTAG